MAMQIFDLQNQRQSLTEKLGLLKTAKEAWETVGWTGWITAGVGTVTVIGGYIWGAVARSNYDHAVNASAATTGRNQVNAASAVFQIGIYGASAGLLTGLVSLIFEPDLAGLSQDINTINSQIQNLEATP